MASPPLDGLTNHELDALVRSLGIKHYVGVYMDDEYDAQIRDNECGIVNYQDSDEDGSHWVAYYTRDDLRYCCYFDSLGFDPTQGMKKYLLSSGKRVLMNPHELQKDSWSCGLYSVDFLRRMDKATNEYEGYYGATSIPSSTPRASGKRPNKGK